MTKKYDLVVLGGGPGGYVAAIRGAQLGMHVACIDANSKLGGTCLRVGCIPSKALLESSERFAEAKSNAQEHGILIDQVGLDLKQMHKRKTRVVQTLTTGINSLLKQHKIEVVRGWGKLTGPGKIQVAPLESGESQESPTELEASHVILAVGSNPAAIAGIELDGDRIGTSSEALDYDAVPDQLVVIGAGYIGLELGSVWRRLGSKVIVLETLDRILPGMDQELAQAAFKIFKKQGLEFRLGTRVQSARSEGERCRIECEGADPIDCDRVLVAVGRRANTDQMGLEEVGVSRTERGEIEVGENFRTNVDRVYAIGDCVRGPKLAHKASHEGIACVNAIAGQPGHVNYDAIPAVVYTHPEMASVGATEDELKASGREFRKGSFPLQASGRARTLGETEGFIKVLSDAQTDRVLGVHILGARAGDLIAEAAAAMEFGASAEDLASICHAHPTLAESIGEAALAAHQMAIHIPPPKRRG